FRGGADETRRRFRGGRLWPLPYPPCPMTIAARHLAVMTGIRHRLPVVLALDVARRNVLRVRVAGTAERLCALYLSGAVTTRWMRNLAIQRVELSVINVRPETRFNGFQIRAVPVARDLYA